MLTTIPLSLLSLLHLGRNNIAHSSGKPMADRALSAVSGRVKTRAHSLAHEVIGVRFAVGGGKGGEGESDDGGELHFEGMDGLVVGKEG